MIKKLSRERQPNSRSELSSRPCRNKKLAAPWRANSFALAVCNAGELRFAR
jgi:hypothetical protein